MLQPQDLVLLDVDAPLQLGQQELASAWVQRLRWAQADSAEGYHAERADFEDWVVAVMAEQVLPVWCAPLAAQGLAHALVRSLHPALQDAPGCCHAVGRRLEHQAVAVIAGDAL